MPIPPQSFHFEGGCNCGAVRYQVDVPAAADRPLRAPVGDQQGEVRLPMIFTDHCNDCRRATGSMLPVWITADISTVQLHYQVRSDVRSSYPNNAFSVPAKKRFSHEGGNDEGGTTYLTTYESSKGVHRGFCGRCGTNLFYWAADSPAGWTEMLDICLGSIDRKYLEEYRLVPERQMHWESGVDWIQKFSTQGLNDGVPKHPGDELGRVVR